MTYETDVIKTRFWSGTLSERRLAETLNKRTANGWRFTFSITAERRILLIFKRASYYLIFEHAGP